MTVNIREGKVWGDPSVEEWRVAVEELKTTDLKSPLTAATSNPVALLEECVNQLHAARREQRQMEAEVKRLHHLRQVFICSGLLRADTDSLRMRVEVSGEITRLQMDASNLGVPSMQHLLFNSLIDQMPLPSGFTLAGGEK